MTRIEALDTSSYSGPVTAAEAQAAYDAGYRFAIVQLWGGTPSGRGPNSLAPQQLEAYRQVGMTTGGYIWIPPDTTVETEELIRVALAAAGPELTHLKLIAPDLEGSPLHPTRPAVRLQNAINQIKAQAPGKTIGIYSSLSMWGKVMFGAEGFSQYHLWDARYDGNPDIDVNFVSYGGWTQRGIKQWSGTFSGPETGGQGIDRNTADLERLQLSLVEPSTPTPPPEEEIELSSEEYKKLSDQITKLSNRLGAFVQELRAHAEHATLPTPPKPPGPGPRQYTVKAGDSLALIAQKQLGNAGRFRDIVRFNRVKYPSLLTNPNFIKPGWVLALPLK